MFTICICHHALEMGQRGGGRRTVAAADEHKKGGYRHLLLAERYPPLFISGGLFGLAGLHVADETIDIAGEIGCIEHVARYRHGSKDGRAGGMFPQQGTLLAIQGVEATV